MSIPYVIDGETDLDSTTINRWIDNINTVPLASITGALEGYQPLANAASRVEDIRTHGGSWQEEDNIPAINAALQSLKTNYGGGEVVFPTHKVYPIKPSNTNRILIPSNCRLNLGDARLQVASDSPAYQTIFTAEGGPSAAVTGVSITGGEIDQNPAGHEDSDARGSGQYVVLLWDAQGVRFEGVNVITGGVNAVVVNGGNCRDVRVNGNTFTFIQAASSEVNYDNSAVYLEALGIEANNNTFYSQHSEQARGCIELHGPLAIAKGNKSYNYWTLFNLVSSGPSLDASVDRYQVVVDGNAAYGARSAIAIWPHPDTVYRGVSITNNQLNIAQISGGWNSYSGISFVRTQSVNGEFEDFDWSHNVIAFEPGDDRSVDGDGNAFAYASINAIGLGMHTKVRNGQVKDNVVTHCPHCGIRVGNTLFTGAEHENVVIEGNLQIDSGCNRSENRDKRTPFFFAGKHTNVRVRNNPLVVTNAQGNSSDQRYIWVISGSTSGGGNVFEGNPVLVNGGHTLVETIDESIFPMRRTASATTLGSVVKKQEVFDQYGVSQGFIPIYDSIT